MILQFIFYLQESDLWTTNRAMKKKVRKILTSLFGPGSRFSHEWRSIAYKNKAIILKRKGSI
jgi:hypothetical protein